VEARTEVAGKPSPLDRMPAGALAAGALAIIAAVLVALAIAGGDTLPERLGPPVEELAVERAELSPNRIGLTVRNTGPDPVTVAQAFVNDAYVDLAGASGPIGRLASERIALTYPWQEGQPYLVSLVTETGVVIEHEIPAAVGVSTASCSSWSRCSASTWA
jgi:zinc transporter, ZIP family